ncbi:MAG: histidine phosphatase family protein [Marivibrio sp.]|uniref:histidine phosphatase family protein n=1 Tax=Marivibrio sp. TaxID=2039719 RepID=UPI0032EDBA91
MILVRHGESEFNVRFAETRQDPGIRDPELTQAGRAQATEAAAFLADHEAGARLRRIIASPYTRALQTAEIIAERLALPIAVEVEIGEHAYFTCDIGAPRSALQERWPALSFDHLAEEWWPTREDDAMVAARARTFRDRAAALSDWPEILAVSHWGFIRGLTGWRVANAAVLRFDPTAPHPTGAELLNAAQARPPEDPSAA